MYRIGSLQCMISIIKQETVVADAIEMNLELQDQLLDGIARRRPNDLQFLKDLEVIRRKVPKEEGYRAKREREAAERRVLLATLEYGEMIGR